MLTMWIVAKKCPMSVPWKWGTVIRNVCLELSIPLYSRSTKNGRRITHIATTRVSPSLRLVGCVDPRAPERTGVNPAPTVVTATPAVFTRVVGAGIGSSFSTLPAYHACVPASPPVIGAFRASHLVNRPRLGNPRLRGARSGAKYRPTPALNPHPTQAPAGSRSYSAPQAQEIEASGRSFSHGGPRGRSVRIRPTCLRILSTTAWSMMNAMTFISAPQEGQTNGSTS